MSDNKTKSNLGRNLSFFGIFILVLGISFFLLTKNASDELSKVIGGLNLNQAQASSQPIISTKKAMPDYIDKAELLFKKNREITWADIEEISPEDQKILYSTFTQDQKDKLVKTWNDLRTKSGGDPSKARN